MIFLDFIYVFDVFVCLIMPTWKNKANKNKPLCQLPETTLLPACRDKTKHHQSDHLNSHRAPTSQHWPLECLQAELWSFPMTLQLPSPGLVCSLSRRTGLYKPPGSLEERKGQKAESQIGQTSPAWENISPGCKRFVCSNTVCCDMQLHLFIYTMDLKHVMVKGNQRYSGSNITASKKCIQFQINRRQ